jgi:hypothetical protein
MSKATTKVKHKLEEVASITKQINQPTIKDIKFISRRITANLEIRKHIGYFSQKKQKQGIG